MSSKTTYHYPDGSVTFDPTLIVTGTGMPSRIEQLERENAALRADKERLDWLSSQKDQPWLYWERPLRLTREAIDAFRKEAQP